MSSKYSFLYVPVLFLLSGLFCFSQSAPDHIKDEIVIPKHYVAHKTSEPITIDGKDLEKSWLRAAFTDNFIDIEGVLKPLQNTRAKILWSDDYLYIFAKLSETNIWATLKQHDTIIFYNNDFEVFIDPSNNTYDYGEIEINALNTVWDLMLDVPYRSNGKPISHWESGVKSAINIAGTLNDFSDTDKFWSVELAIPMKALLELKGSKDLPKEGEQWRLNFSRVEWDFELIDGHYKRKKVGGKYAPEHNWVWSNQKVINMHEPEKWGYLQFSELPLGHKVKYKPADDLLLRQVGFALFRNCLSGKISPGKDLREGDEKVFDPFYVNGSMFKASYLKTYTGYNIKVSDSDKNLTIYIDQNGRITHFNQ